MVSLADSQKSKHHNNPYLEESERAPRLYKARYDNTSSVIGNEWFYLKEDFQSFPGNKSEKYAAVLFSISIKVML